VDEVVVDVRYQLVIHVSGNEVIAALPQFFIPSRRRCQKLEAPGNFIPSHIVRDCYFIRVTIHTAPLTLTASSPACAASSPEQAKGNANLIAVAILRQLTMLAVQSPSFKDEPGMWQLALR
jgi:hypothetical protein